MSIVSPEFTQPTLRDGVVVEPYIAGEGLFEVLGLIEACGVEDLADTAIEAL
jgi:hypothetical protein